MARDGWSSANYFLSSDGGMISAYPSTMAFWFYVTDLTTATSVPFQLYNSGDTTLYILCRISQVDDQIRCRFSGGTEREMICSTVLSVNTWYHCILRFTSTTARSILINNGGEVSNTSSETFPVLGDFVVGAQWAGGSVFVLPMNGRICEICMWNVDLDDSDERAALAAGCSPLLIRPTAIQAYWPMHGYADPEIDYKCRSSTARDNPLNMNGTVTRADHAPMVPYTMRRSRAPEIGVAAATVALGRPWHIRDGSMPKILRPPGILKSSA